jgi:hypothetical protein
MRMRSGNEAPDSTGRATYNPVPCRPSPLPCCASSACPMPSARIACSTPSISPWRTGEAAALLGPSGCGKTTLLRLVAGFESVQQGAIRLNGSVVSDAAHHLPPERRQLGMVFQDFALFPHLTVAGNIAFGLGAMARSDRAARVDALLDLVGLPKAQAAGIRTNSPADSSSGSPWRAPSRRGRRSSCWTNRSRVSTWACANSWRPRSATCSATRAPAPSS